MSRWQPIASTVYDSAFDRQHPEQRRDRDDFVGLLRHLDLPKHQSLARRERRNHVDRLLRTLLGSARRLAVDGDHIGWHTGQRRHPRYEASLELLGVERRQNVAEVIVGRRSVAKRAEPPQQLEFLLAE